MNYFVYFICLLCSTSLTTTMLDSYDVSETLNDFIKTCCSVNHWIWVFNLWILASKVGPYLGHVLSFYISALWGCSGRKRECRTSREGRLGIGFWESSTNPYKRLSGYKAEMRGSRAERTENRLELTIILSPTAPASPELKYERRADYFGLLNVSVCFCHR